MRVVPNRSFEPYLQKCQIRHLSKHTRLLTSTFYHLFKGLQLITYVVWCPCVTNHILLLHYPSHILWLSRIVLQKIAHNTSHPMWIEWKGLTYILHIATPMTSIIRSFVIKLFFKNLNNNQKMLHTLEISFNAMGVTKNYKSCSSWW